MLRYYQAHHHIKRNDPVFRIFLYLSVLLIFSSFSLFAQNSFVNRQKTNDSLNKRILNDTLTKKRFGRAAIELGLGEAVTFSIDRFIRHTDFTKISFKTIGYNLKPGNWGWDADDFSTNQIGHPFHGSVYFNAFRSNGYSFWQSIPASVAGSYIWETAGETTGPSVNDFINTGFGGTMLGEVTHRLANRIVNSRSRGFKRQAGEVVAFIINPSNGLNRILDGQWGKVPGNSVAKDTTPIAGKFDLGLRRYSINNKDPFTDGHFGLYARMKLVYGTPAENIKDAFGNFYVVVEAGHDHSSKLNIVSAYGSLTGWKAYFENRTDIAVLSANYDYINNEAFFYGAESVKLNYYANFILTNKIGIDATVGTGPIVLAAIPDAYKYQGRNYDYGSGLSYYSSLKLIIADRFYYAFNYRGGWTTTLNGNPSYYFLHVLTNELGMRILKKVSLSVEDGYFNLLGYYRHFDDVNKIYPYVRLSVTYNTNL